MNNTKRHTKYLSSCNEFGYYDCNQFIFGIRKNRKWAGSRTGTRVSLYMATEHGDYRDEHVNNVYAYFGLAMYFAQVLEHGIANTMMCAELLPRRDGKPVPKKAWEAEFDAFMNEQYQQTLGRLIRALKNATSVPPDLEGILTAALEKRNYLAHHYFRERAEAFMSWKGREKMIEELQGAQKLFDDADARITAVERQLREKYGLTNERLRPWEEKYLKSFERDI
jgi:hypothetical protein